MKMNDRVGKVNDMKSRLSGFIHWVVLQLFVLVLIAGTVTISFGAGGTVMNGGPKQDIQLHKQAAVASVTDAQGNVYVTGIRNLAGNSDDDWWTIRFNPDGSVAWRTAYNRSGGTDTATAITLDADRDVIVTGIASNGVNIEIHTEKYNGSNGTLIWARTFAGSGNDMASAVAVDNQKNVYVAGYTRNSQGKKHALVIKYSHSDIPAQDGLLLWQRIHDIDSTNIEEVRAVAADDNGVVITGFSGPGPDYDLLTVVYNNVGDQIWEKRYRPASSANWGKLVKLDLAGNVVVSGFTTNVLGNKDIYTAKYQRANPGSLIWEETYDSTYEDEPMALAVDNTGNVYVTGSTYTMAGAYDFYTVKYGREPQSGTVAKKEWANANIFDSGNSDIPVGIVVDPNGGDVYVTGHSDNNGQTDFQTIRIKGDSGVELWRSTYDNALHHNDHAIGIGLSTDGDVLVTGWSDMTEPFDGGAALASGGSKSTVENSGRTWVANQWQGFFVTMTSGDNTGFTRRISGNGDKVLTLESDLLLLVKAGDSYIISDRENYDYLLIKYQAGGVNRPTGLVAQAVTANSIKLDWVDNSANEDGFNVYRWDPVGKAWNKLGAGVTTVGSSSGSTGSYVDNSGIVADTRYDYHVTSIKNSPSDESRPSNQVFAVTTIMNPVSPAPANIYTFDSAEQNDEVGVSIAVGPDNKPVVTGHAMTSIGGYDYITQKLNTNMSLAWQDVYDDPDHGTDEATVVSVDRSSNVIVSGYSELDNGTGNSSHIFTQKYSGAGKGDGTTTTIWHAQYTSTPRINDRAEAVATTVDSSNNIAVAGRGLNSNNNYDIYVVKYAPDPNPDMYGNNVPSAGWNAAPYNRGGDDQPTAVAFDSAGNIFVAGYSEQSEENVATVDSTDASATEITSGAAWPVDKWKYSNVIITSGVNLGEIRRITGNSATTLTVDTPFPGGPITSGTTFSISNYDWFVAKYNGTTGARIWTDIFDSGFGDDQAFGAAVDPASGDLYVTGYRANASGDRDIYTIKYKGSPASAPIAQKLWPGDGGRFYDGAGHGDDYAVDVKVAPITGQVVVGGSVYTSAGDHDYVLIKYNPDGTPAWAPEARIPLKTDSDDIAKALTIDNSENIYLTGTITRSGSGSDSMTLKYSPEGVLMSTTVFNGAAALDDESVAITANSRGEVFVAGSTQAGAANKNLLVYKIEADPLQIPYPLGVSADYRFVTLSWPDNSSGEGGYNLQRTTGNCAAVTEATSWFNLGPLGSNKISFTDIGLNIGSSYCYRIQSFVGTVGNAGYRESLWAMASVTTLNPEAPANLTTTTVNTNRIDLAWSLPLATGHTGFIIERCTGSSCTFAETDPSKVVFPEVKYDVISYSDTTVCAGTTYRYRILSSNNGLGLGNSGGWSKRMELVIADYRPNSYARITVNHVAPMKADFSDIRFMDPVTQKEMPFWIESKIDSGSAVVAVKTGISNKAWLYYGNASAQNSGAVTGLVAYWPFNEGIRNTGTTDDQSGNANTGTLTYIQAGNGIVAAGKFGNGLKLDGSNDHVRVADSASLDLTGSFTLETWYQYDPSQAWARIITKPGTGGSNPYIVYGMLLDDAAGAQSPYLELTNTGSPKGPNLNPGSWYHLVGRYNAGAGRASIFVNGIEYGQNVTPIALVPNAEPLGIGSAGIYNATLKGTLDEVKIYSRPLFDQEIFDRYNMYSSAIATGVAEPPPVGSTFDFAPLAWQSVYVMAANSVVPPAAAPSLTSVNRISEVRMDLSWTDNSADETGFLIERMCTAGPGCPTPETVYTAVAGGALPSYSGTGAKAFSDTSVTANTTYSYRVRALKIGACGWNDGPGHDILSSAISKTTTVNAPVITSTTVANTTELDLVWTDDATTLTGYRVERCTGTSAACASGTFVVVGGSPGKSYDDIDACANTDYTYRVASVFKGLTASGAPWAKRTQLTFDPGTFKANFKTRLTLPYNAAMKQDFSDIRFFDTVANRELPYYIESKTDGVSATVWIRTGDNDSIQLYYGNRKAVSVSSTQGVFGAGLMSYWRFDEPTGIASTTPGDLIGGTGNDPLIAPVTANYGIVAGGVYGNALRLNGSMSATKGIAAMPVGGIVSVEAWIKPEGYIDPAYNGIVSWGPRSGSANSFIMSVQNNGRPSMATWGNDIVPGTGTTATINQWNHIAVVMNNKAVTFYMNGTPFTGTLGNMPVLQSINLSIGSGTYPLGLNFKGFIDELRVYNQALTAQDIASSYTTVFPVANVSFAASESAPTIPGESLGPYSTIIAQSANKTSTPAKPTGLVVTWVSEKELKLTWNDNTSDESGYVVERKCTAGSGCSDPDYAPVPASPIPLHAGTGSMTFNDTNLNSAWTYSYRVRPYKTTTCGNVWDNAGGVLNSNVAAQTTTVKEPSLLASALTFGTRCNDIRFTDSDGTTLLPFWMREDCNTTATLLFTRQATVPANSSTIYMYYGNSTAPSAFNGTATFDFFDDFSGSSIDTTTKWNLTNGTGFTVSDGYLHGSNTTGRLTSKATFSSTTPSVLQVRAKTKTIATHGQMIAGFYGSPSDNIGWLDYPGSMKYVLNGVETAKGDQAPLNALLTHNITLADASNAALTLVNFDTRTTYWVPEAVTKTLTNLPIVLGKRYDDAYGGESYVTDWDWVYVRKYAAPTPTTVFGGSQYNASLTPYLVDGISLYGRKPITVSNTGAVLNGGYQLVINADTTTLATDQITITWKDELASETGYTIKRCDAGAAGAANCDPLLQPDYATIGPNLAAIGSYNDENLSFDKRYCYSIKALLPDAVTSFSTTTLCSDTSKPTAPTALNRTINGTKVDLTWSDTTLGIPDSYILERCNDHDAIICSFNPADAPSDFRSVVVPRTQKSYSDTDTCTGVTYRYRVKSVKPWVSAWPSTYTNTVDAPLSLPAQPSNVRVTRASETQMDLTWNDNSGDESGYRVLRCSGTDCVPLDPGPGSRLFPDLAAGTQAFSDYSLTPNTSYTYQVVGFKNGTCGWTSGSLITVDAKNIATTRPAPVLSASAFSADTNRIDLGWTDTTATESGYSVLRCSDASCSSSTLLATVGVGVNAYSDTSSICNATTYYYQVKGFKDANLSFANSGKWLKRVPITFTAFQPDYQTKLAITLASYPGIDATTLKDVRFYDTTAGNELPYWIESISAGVATVWLKTGKNSTSIYMYYSNTSATSASSDRGAFPFFDNLENGIGKWKSGNAVQVASPVHGGAYAGMLTTSGASTQDYADITSITRGKVAAWYYLSSKMNIVAATLSDSSWTDRARISFGSDGQLYASRKDAIDIDFINYGVNTWNKIEIEFDATSNPGTYKVYLNGYLRGGPYNLNTNGGTVNDIRYLKIATVDAAGEIIYFDDVMVTNYSSAVPSAAVGVIESSGTGYTFATSWIDQNVSNVASAAPQATTPPTLVSAIKASESRIDLSWSDANKDEAGFYIDRCRNASCSPVEKPITFSQPASAIGSFSDTGLIPGSTYYYRLRAFKPQPVACGGNWVSSNSSTLSDTTTAPVPTSLFATTEGSNLVHLAWTDTTLGDSGFSLERSEGGSPFTQIGGVGPLADPYLVRYTFNNTLTDSSGNGLHLTGTPPIYEDGGIRLSTSTSYQSPLTSILDSDTYTIEFDFKMKGVTPNAGSWYQVFAYRPPGYDRSPGIWQENSSRAMFTWQHNPAGYAYGADYSGISGLGPKGVDGSQFALDSWYHIKGVKNGSNFKIYINGGATPVAENTAVANPKPPGSSALYFGGAEIVLKNFTISQDAVQRRLYTDNTPCSGHSYTYQVRAINRGLSLDGNGCWMRRTPLAFSNFQPNFQTKVVINSANYPAATIDSVNYAGMQSDFRDIRFYDANTDTELPYSIEKIVGTTATVWLKTGTSKDNIYLYYGNPAAVSAANAEKVFEFFDDFNEGRIDTNKWTIMDNTGFSVSGGYLHGTDNTGKLATQKTFGTDILIETKTRSSLSAINGHTVLGFEYLDTSNYNRCLGWFNKDGAGAVYYGYCDSIYSSVANSGVFPVNGNMLYRVKFPNSTTMDVEMENYDSATPFWSRLNSAISSQRSPATLILGRRTFARDSVPRMNEPYMTDWDWFRARKYAAVEPSVAFGSGAAIEKSACFSFSSAWPVGANLVSNTQTVTLPTLAAPAGLTVAATGDKQAALTWLDNSADETGFSIERCTGIGSTACDFTILDAGFPLPVVTNSTTYTNSGLSAQTNYCYRIRSYRNEVCAPGQVQSGYSSTACAMTSAAAPYNLQAVAQNAFKVTLTWNYAATANEDGFEVQRQLPGGGWSLIGTTKSDVMTFTDTSGIEPGKKYVYRVRAFYGKGGILEPTDWTQRAFIRNVTGGVVAGEDITAELSGTPIDIVDVINGTARITPLGGTVELVTTSTGGGTATTTSTSRTILKNLAPYGGDFDVQVDYSLPDGQLNSGQWVVYARLHVAFGPNYASIYRAINNGVNQYYGLVYADGKSSFAALPTSDTSGRLRIKRMGEVITIYVWSGEKWIAVHQGSCSPLPASSVQLLQEVRRLDTAAVRVRYSNFASADHNSPYSDPATVSYTNGGTTIYTTPVYTQGATPCN